MVELVNSGRFTALEPAIAQLKADHPGRYDTPLSDQDGSGTPGPVVGYADPRKNQRFRVDHTPLKGLHLMWEQGGQDAHGNKSCLKECYLVVPPTLRPEDELYIWRSSPKLPRDLSFPAQSHHWIGGSSVWRGTFGA